MRRTVRNTQDVAGVTEVLTLGARNTFCASFHAVDFAGRALIVRQSQGRLRAEMYPLNLTQIMLAEEGATGP